MFSYVLVKVEKVNYDLEPQQVRTPDRAVISISASVTWVPGIEDSPESFITYLNSGGEEGVKKIIHDVIEDRVKTWAGSNREGPSTWMEAQAMKDDAHNVLVKSLLGNSLAPISVEFQGVPTSTWMRFFDEPKSEPTEYDANPRNRWAHRSTNADGNRVWNWKKLQAIFDGYSPANQAKLKQQIEQRRRDVKKIREGKGDFGDDGLGITIVRFSVNEVKVEGKVADSAELEEKERREREADRMEIDNVSDRAKKLKADHPDLTSQQAFELVQTERGKVGKTIIAVSGAKTDVGSDLLGLAGLAKEIVSGLKGGGKPSADPSTKKGNKKGRKKDPDMTDREVDDYLDRFANGEEDEEEDDEEEKEKEKEKKEKD